MQKTKHAPQGLLRITRIIRKPLQGPTYNLAVREDESYVAEGVIVHNCRSILIPVTKDEGPVSFITAAQIGRGLQLKQKGF